MYLNKVYLRLKQYFEILLRYFIDLTLKLIAKTYQTINLLFFESGLEKQIYINRSNSKSVGNFIYSSQYETSSDKYGLPQSILKYINRDLNKYPTYTDLIPSLFKFLNVKITYLEIGVSVMKNFYLISSGSKGLEMYAFDINQPNKAIESKFDIVYKEGNYSTYKHNENNLHYYQGDVFNKNNLNEFKNIIKKSNFIFSDAHHSYDGLISEYKNLIQDILDDKFLIYYDDLSGGMKKAFFEIAEDLSLSNDIEVFTFLINGWVGQHEKMHRNGIITNLKLQKELINSNIKLLGFKSFEYKINQ